MFYRFRIVPATISNLKRDVKKTLSDSLTREFDINMDGIVDFDSVVSKVCEFASMLVQHIENVSQWEMI